MSLAGQVEQGTAERAGFAQRVDGEGIPPLVGDGPVRQVSGRGRDFTQADQSLVGTHDPQREDVGTGPGHRCERWHVEDDEIDVGDLHHIDSSSGNTTLVAGVVSLGAR